MRRAEAVEEVDERNAPLDSGKMGDRREVHDLLDVSFGQHGEAGLAACHDVGMVAEDAERLGGDRASADMEDAREHLCRDLVHVRNHEEQALEAV